MDGMKVGEVARRTGLTVRTLHHYEEIGLLQPGGRTASGHRLYGAAELQRLQQIASLKLLGVPLGEIRDALDRPGYSLGQVLELQVERIGEEIERQGRLRTRIESLLAKVRSGEGLSIDELAKTIEVTVRCERYYSSGQLQTLERRRSEVGEERMREAQNEWSELFSAFGQAMRDGIDPTDPRVRALAERSAGLIGEFTGGDPGIERSLDSMYQAEGGERVLDGFGFDMPPGLFEYMGAAREALASSPGGTKKGAAG